MNTEELLVHDGSKGKRAERFHASLVHLLRVLMLAFELEGEVVGQMAAFVVATKEPQGVGIPNLQRPQIQNALRHVSTSQSLPEAWLPQC
jgi:hypothetical protein